MKYKQYLIQAATFWTLLLVLMITTKPASLPVVVLMLPFIVLFLALISSWRLLRSLGGRNIGRKEHPRGERLGFVVCLSLVLLLVLQSLGQLTLRDGITVIALAFIGYLYMLRFRPVGRE